MGRRINKLINYKGKEYAHIIEDEPAPFCDFCVFSDLCEKVLRKELEYNNSPMSICSDLCEKENTNFGFFIESNKAEKYCNS